MQLHAAAARGDIAGMAAALDDGAALDDCDGSGRTALIFSLERTSGFSEMSGPRPTLDSIRFLLDRGANVEVPDQLGLTAVHHAAQTPDPRFLDAILHRGGDPRHVTKSGYSVALSACFQPPGTAKLAILRRLHREGCDLDAASEFRESPLGVCLRFGDLTALRLLLELGADIGQLGWSEAHRRVALESVDALRALAPTPESINAKSPRSGFSPWLLATIRGDLGIVRWLAEASADLTQRGRCGVSGLHLACEFGHLAVARWWMDLGMSPDEPDDFGGTPLGHAAEENRIECARELLARGARAGYEDRSTLQPITDARSLEMLELLVREGGADVNALDGCGDWPLKSAAARNDVDSLRWLLENGAHVDRTSTGETALHAAVQADAREAVRLLLDAGADPDAQDVDGWTPLFGVQSVETIQALLDAGADPGRTDIVGSGAEWRITDRILRRALRAYSTRPPSS